MVGMYELQTPRTEDGDEGGGVKAVGVVVLRVLVKRIERRRSVE